MNTSKVKIKAHSESGEIVTQNPNKPDFGSIRVDQEITSFEGGFLNRQNRVAFIGGRMEDLQSLGYKEGTTLPGKIVVIETLEPQYTGHSPKINPETGEELTQSGQAIYRDTKYTENQNVSDQLLSHDTVEQTVEAKEKQEAEMSIS